MPILGENYFDLQSLCAAINILPNMVGKINRANIFPIKGETNRTLVLDERENEIVVLGSREPGAPSDLSAHEIRRARTFIVPHFPLDDVVLPEDVQSIREFGTDAQTDPIARKINDRLQVMRNKHDITLEYLRMGALKGQIIDGDLNVITDLFSEFGITQQTFTFNFSSADADILSTCRNVVRYISQSLHGESMSMVKAYVAADFMDQLVRHPSVKETWANWNAAAEIRGLTPTSTFRCSGIEFEEYSDIVSLRNGTSVPMVADNEGHAFPVGTVDMYGTHCAPADFNETVNTIGLAYYAKLSERKHGRGYDLHTQSNPLPLCYRPQCLVKLEAA